MNQLRHTPAASATARFRLDRQNGMVGGVCSGIARRFDVDPLLVRLAFVLGTLVGLGSLLLVYALIWLLAE